MEGLEDVGPTFVADDDPPEAGEPCQGALDFPAVAAEPFAVFDAAARDAGNDGAPAQSAPAAGEIIALVGVQLGGPAAGPAGALANGRDGVDRGFQHPAVVDVGGRQGHGERDAVGVDDDVALGPRLAPVGRVRPGLKAPLT